MSWKDHKLPFFTVKTLEASGVTEEDFKAVGEVIGQETAIAKLKELETRGLKPKTIITVARKLNWFDSGIVDGFEALQPQETKRPVSVDGTTGSKDTPATGEVAEASGDQAEAKVANEAAGDGAGVSGSAEATETTAASSAAAAGARAKVATKASKGRGKKAETKTDEPKRVLTAKERIELALSSVKKRVDSSVGGFDVPLIATARELMNLGILHSEKIPTGFPALDIIADGGVPKGKFTVIAGPEQSCKSTLTQRIVAADQAANPNHVWLWLDAENSFDPVYAMANGIDLDRLLVEPPDIMEHLLQRAVEIVISGAVTGVVLDSVGGLTPWEELKTKRDDKEFLTRNLADNTMAALAKRIGQFFRLMNIPAARTKTTCILIGHVYTPIGEMYGPEFVVKGGNALKHWSHLRIMTRRKKGDQEEKRKTRMPDGTEKDLFVAYEAVFTIDKTRQGAHQYHEVSIPYVYGKGLSNEKSVVDMAFAYNVIETKGSWYGHPSFPEKHEGQGDRWINGREQAEKYILENPEAFSAVLTDVGTALANADNTSLESQAPAVEVSPEEMHVV